MASLWSDSAGLPSFPHLTDNVKTDVLIIGGGMAGLLCAYLLTQAGVDCILAEARDIGGGATKNTTAKITIQHGLIYDKLLRSLGPERAGMYLRANQAALEQFRELCGHIDCEFEEKDAYVYSKNSTDQLLRETEALRRLGAPAQFVKALPLPFPISGAVCLRNQAQFHPLKFLRSIAQGLPIYENSPIIDIRGHTAFTDGGSVTARRMIVATHFPFLNKHGSYFLKLYQHRSYVLALENAPDVGGMYVDEQQDGLSFRNSGGLLLLGGGDHRTGRQGGGWKELELFAEQYYPESRIAYRWSAQDCMSLDGIPYIGQYSAHTPGCFVASGFNKWGMSSSMVAAMILRDRILGKENPHAAVFSPSRSILKPQLAVNAALAVTHLLTPTRPRCPHLGCALKWNRAEHTWDCPCHGSRFAEDGRLIDNPATGNLKSSVCTPRRRK